jgi:hypothetical protein
MAAKVVTYSYKEMQKYLKQPLKVKSVSQPVALGVL